MKKHSNIRRYPTGLKFRGSYSSTILYPQSDLRIEASHISRAISERDESQKQFKAQKIASFDASNPVEITKSENGARLILLRQVTFKKAA